MAALPGSNCGILVGIDPDPQAMRNGLTALRNHTGADFGYDLMAWHTYLLEHEGRGYTFGNHHNGYLEIIREIESSPHRMAIYESLTKELENRKESER